MRNILIFISFISVVLGKNNRPNIIFIMTDDQGAWTIGANGYKEASTPNLDKLFNNGINFKKSYVNTPVCSPSRASFLTSRHGSDFFIRDWLHKTEKGLIKPVTTWTKVLQKHNYKTALFGKWHLGHDEKSHPTLWGYDEFFGIISGGCSPKDPYLEENGTVKKFKGLAEDLFTDKAIEFIKNNKTNNFAISLHYRAPHKAWLPVAKSDKNVHKKTQFPMPDYITDKFRSKLQKDLNSYACSVTCIDRNVGRLMTSLKKYSLLKNTIIIFTSDHGYNVGQYGLWSKGNSYFLYKDTEKSKFKDIPDKVRPNLYNTSLQVPTCIMWQGKIISRVDNKNFISNLDWFPTILQLCNIKVPENLLGKDISKIILTEERRQIRPYLYSYYNMKKGAIAHMHAVFDDKYKYMRDFHNIGREELYDLKSDPEEKNNLYQDKAYQDIKAKYNDLLISHMQKLYQHNTINSIKVNFCNIPLHSIEPEVKFGESKGAFWNNIYYREQIQFYHLLFLYGPDYFMQNIKPFKNNRVVHPLVLISPPVPKWKSIKLLHRFYIDNHRLLDNYGKLSKVSLTVDNGYMNNKSRMIKSPKDAIYSSFVALKNSKIVLKNLKTSFPNGYKIILHVNYDEELNQGNIVTLDNLTSDTFTLTKSSKIYAIEIIEQ